MWLAVEIPTWGWLQKQFIKDALEATRFFEYAWLSEEINQSISEGLQCDSFAHWYHDLMQVCPCRFIDRCLLLLFSLQWPSLTIWSFISLTLWRFRTMVSFLSAQSWYKIFVNKPSLEFSFPSIDSIKTSFVFFLPIWGCYYTRNLCLWQCKHKVNKFALSMLEKHTQVRLSLL